MARALQLPARMMSATRSVGLFSGALLLGLLGGCELETIPPGGGGPSGNGYTRIPSADPSYDERLDQLGIVCQSTLQLSGTFVESMPRPATFEADDCWPIGTWTIAAVVEFEGCSPQPEPEEHVYEARVDEDANWTVENVNDPDNERQNLKLTFDSSNLCLGKFEHYGEDFTVWNLQPTVDPTGLVAGQGTFAVYTEDPF